VVTFLIPGHETTAAVSLSWTWHLLAQNPSAENRLHEEVDRVLGDRLAGAVARYDLSLNCVESFLVAGPG